MTPAGAVPSSSHLDEQSVPNPHIAPGPIMTVSQDEISRFFVRVRRDQDTERWDIRLDGALREILERANEFVPSESGGILLDDPRAKLAGVRTPRSFSRGSSSRIPPASEGTNSLARSRISRRAPSRRMSQRSVS